MEEYSSEDEVNIPINNKSMSQIDPVIIQIVNQLKIIFTIIKNNNM